MDYKVKINKPEKISLNTIQSLIDSINIQKPNFQLNIQLYEKYLDNQINYFQKFFVNLNYLFSFKEFDILKYHSNKDNLGKIITTISLFLFKELINEERNYCFNILYQVLIYFFENDILILNDFSLINRILVKISLKNALSKEDFLNDSFKEIELIINSFIKHNKPIKPDLIEDIIIILKDELFINLKIKTQLHKNFIFLNLLKLNIEKESLKSIINFLIEIYNFKFSTQNFTLIYEECIINLSNFGSYLEMLFNLFKYEKMISQNQKIFIKEGIIISEKCPILSNNFQLNLYNYSLIFSFRIFNFIENEETVILKIFSSQSIKNYLKITINSQHILMFHYIEGNKEIIKETQEIKENQDYLIYLYQKEHLFDNAIISYINGIKYVHEAEIKKDKDALLEIGSNMNGLLGSFFYLDKQLNEDSINDLFHLRDNYHEISSINNIQIIQKNKKIKEEIDSLKNMKFNILLNISNKVFNEITPENGLKTKDNTLIQLINQEKKIQIIHNHSSFESFFNEHFGFKFLIFQLHNITSVSDVSIFQKCLFKILDFVKNIMIEFNDNLIQNNLFTQFHSFFMSLIIVLNKTKKEQFIIEFDSSIIEILISLMNFFSKKNNHILCSLIISILLMKDYYTSNFYIPIIFKISLCLNKYIYVPIEEVLKFDILLDGNDHLTYYNFLKKIISLNNTKEQSEKIFNHLIRNYKNNERRKYFYLKLIYTNIDLFYEYLQELSQKEEYYNYYGFLNEQMMKKINRTYKISVFNQCLSYLLVQECFNLVLKNEGSNNKMFLSVYDFMNKPTRAFLRTIFLQILEVIDNKTKLNYIQSKEIPKFNNLFFSSIVNDDVFNHNFITIIKYYIDIYNNLDETKSQDLIFQMVNNFIVSFLQNSILQSNQKLLLKGNFFSDDGIKIYFNFYFQNRNQQALEFLKNIIHISKLQIYNPFYYKFISESSFYDKELSEFIIYETIMSISNIEKFKNEITFQEFLYVLNLCYYLIVEKKENISKKLQSLIIYYLHTLKDKLLIQLQFIYLFKEKNQININKTILEMVIEILIIFYIDNNYDDKFKSLFNNFLMINHDSIFYNIDQKELEKKAVKNLIPLIDFSKNIGKKIDYLYTLYSLKFFLNIEKQYCNEQLVPILNKILSQIFNDSLKLVNSSLLKKSNISLNEKCKEYIQFLQINRKNSNLFMIFRKQFFERKKGEDHNNSMNISNQKDESTDVLNDKSLTSDNQNSSNENPKNRVTTFIMNKNIKKNIKKHKRNSFSKKNKTINNNEMKIRKVKSSKNLYFFNPLSNDEHIEIENKLDNINYEYDCDNILLYYFKSFFSQNQKDIHNFLFYIKEKLLWSDLSIFSKDWVFKNQKFINLKRKFISIHKNDKFFNNNIELPYPSILKNYVVDDYYKPFIKPDLKFFNHPLLSKSHPYFDNKEYKEKNIYFKKYFPFEKSEFNYECELISIKGVIYGEIHLYDKYLFFKDNSLNDKRFDNDLSIEKKFNYILSYEKNSRIKGKNKDILIYYSNIKEVLIRRFCFEEIELEFILENHKTYLFNFFNKENISQFIQKIKPKLTNEKYNITEFDCNKIFKSKNYEKLFLSNQLSNFKYLLLVNKYSTRTYNDINQYLIFPIIYLSLEPKKERDPSKALCLQKYESNQNNDFYWQNYKTLGQHFNVHYSAGGHILYYLVRQNPITYDSIKFQSGKFDVASRLFYSIEHLLYIYRTTEENRELIPEFFYDYNFMINLNKNELGYNVEIEKNINNVSVEDSKNQIEFIIKHRISLEKFNIGPWLDIIFGINQRNKNIINTFPLYSYDDENNYDKLFEQFENEGKKGEELYKAIKNELIFYTIGVTPVQLLTNIQEKETFKKSIPIIDNKIKEKLDTFIEKQESDYFMFSDNDFIYFKFIDYFVSFDYKNSFKLNEMKIGKQIDIIPQENSFCKLSIKNKDIYKKLLFFVRFSDGTLKLFKEKDFKIFQWNCIITSIVSFESEFQNFIIIGDENGFLSILLFNEEQFSLSIQKKKKSNNSMIKGLVINYRLDIIIAYDKNNLISINCISSFITLSIIELSVQIINIKISNFDILYIQTQDENNENIISLYTLNGLKSNELIINKPNKIINYFTDVNDYVLIATNNSLNFVQCYDLSKKEKEINIQLNENKNEKEETFELKHLIYLYNLNAYCFINEKNKLIIGSYNQEK